MTATCSTMRDAARRSYNRTPASTLLAMGLGLLAVGCGPTAVLPRPPGPTPPVTRSTCPYTNDGECDDGRPGAVTSLCPPGSDEGDCQYVGGGCAPAGAQECSACSDAYICRFCPLGTYCDCSTYTCPVAKVIDGPAYKAAASDMIAPLILNAGADEDGATWLELDTGYEGLYADVVWHSDMDGIIATEHQVEVLLSPGAHAIWYEITTIGDENADGMGFVSVPRTVEVE